VITQRESSREAAEWRRDLAILAFHGLEAEVEHRPGSTSDFIRQLTGPEGSQVGYRSADRRGEAIKRTQVFLKRFNADGSETAAESMSKHLNISFNAYTLPPFP